MDWSINNYAHTALWAVVSFHHRHELRDIPLVTFEQGGEWPLNKVIKSSPGQAPEMTSNQALKLATIVDSFFNDLFDCSYEANFNKSTAITALTDAFKQTDKDLKSVGVIADQCYRTLSEV
mgnify:CR=1 FL=1